MHPTEPLGMEPAESLDLLLQEEAQKLSKEFIITDGHIDLPYRLKVQNFKLTKEFIGIPIEL